MGLFGKLFSKSEKQNEIPEQVMLLSPLKGQVLSLDQIHDEVFASGTLGPGVAIDPTEGELESPVDGEVTMMFPTGHAIGLRTDEGIEILIHIGKDTVELNGKFFRSHVEEGQHVKVGQRLITFDLDAIRNAGYVTEVPVLITDKGSYGSINVLASGQIETGNPLLSVDA